MRKTRPLTWRCAEEGQLPDIQKTERMAALALWRLMGAFSSVTVGDVEYKDGELDGAEKTRKD